jgi:hypothetical protein
MNSIDVKSPTKKQISFATVITQHLDITLNEGDLDSFSKCSLFISKHKERFDLFMEKRNELKDQIDFRVTQAYRVHTWMLAERMQLDGSSLELIANTLEVKLETSVIRYVEKLAQWRKENEGSKEYEWIMGMIVMLLKGEDIESIRQLKYTM